MSKEAFRSIAVIVIAVLAAINGLLIGTLLGDGAVLFTGDFDWGGFTGGIIGAVAAVGGASWIATRQIKAAENDTLRLIEQQNDQWKEQASSGRRRACRVMSRIVTEVQSETRSVAAVAASRTKFDVVNLRERLILSASNALREAESAVEEFATRRRTDQFVSLVLSTREELTARIRARLTPDAISTTQSAEKLARIFLGLVRATSLVVESFDELVKFRDKADALTGELTPFIKRFQSISGDVGTRAAGFLQKMSDRAPRLAELLGAFPEDCHLALKAAWDGPKTKSYDPEIVKAISDLFQPIEESGRALKQLIANAQTADQQHTILPQDLTRRLNEMEVPLHRAKGLVVQAKQAILDAYAWMGNVDFGYWPDSFKEVLDPLKETLLQFSRTELMFELPVGAQADIRRLADIIEDCAQIEHWVDTDVDRFVLAFTRYRRLLEMCLKIHRAVKPELRPDELHPDSEIAGQAERILELLKFTETQGRPIRLSEIIALGEVGPLVQPGDVSATNVVN